jgi:acetylornithine/LysW-gamma-L-lysine aminotransferase
MGAFHGKTMGALSATWKKKYRRPFMPLVPGFKHVPPNNLEKMRAAITDNTAAVMVEPIRGEGGVLVPSDDFLPGLREICDEKGILLIFDEVQTGFGRTGKVFACEHWNVVPDIMCVAKSIAGGIPMGATFAMEEVMYAFKRGEHSSTFSGNPLVCAAANAAIDVLIKERLPERAATLGGYFKANLEALAEKYRVIREVRGLGLMLGMEMRFDVYKMLLGCIERGVLVLDAGRNVLRFLPPLVIKKEQINRVVEVLDEVMEKENR